MRTEKLLAAVLAVGIWGPASVGLAQQADAGPDSQQQQPPQQKTLLGRLNDFGRSLFGGQGTNNQTDNTTPPPSPPPSPSDDQGQQQLMQPEPPRAGGVAPSPSRIAGGQLPDEPPADMVPNDSGGASNVPSGLPAVGDSWSRYTVGGSAAPTGPDQGISPPSSPAPAPTAPTASPADSSAAGTPGPALHELLEGFRDSVFTDDSAAPSRGAPSAAAAPPAAVPSGAVGNQTPTLAPPRPSTAASPSPPVEDPSPLPSSPAPASPSPWSPAPVAPSPAAGSRLIGPIGQGGQSSQSSPPAPKSSPVVESRSEPAPEAEPGVLIARKGPMLSVQTKGPRRIAIGKEAVYEVQIENAGDVAAEEVAVAVGLPESADMAGVEASAGTSRVSPPGNGGTWIQWNLSRLEARARERLVLRLVPRQNRPFDLAVRWDCKAAASQATIEVQEPRLVLRLEGPSEVSYGKKEVFRLHLSNSGNGMAENVLLRLLPLGSGDNRPVSHSIAALAAGEERVLEVELTARQTGVLTIQVGVKADSGAHAEVAQRVLVRRAGLQVAAEGPAVQYVGAAAIYRIHLRNPGNAPARNLRLAADLPAGGKYLAGSEGAHLTTGNQVQWTLAALEAGTERTYTVKCSLGLPGAARIEVRASADDELTAVSEALTRVAAMAELRLEVKEPDGPVPVGDEAVYELHVHNRGTKEAQDVEILGYFSAGIEPVAAEGAAYRLGPGRVLFQPIASLPAGEEVKLTIRARAAAAGNHVFRAEVHCPRLGTRLVSEQTTHFYQEGHATLQAARDLPPLADGQPQAEPPRTADRRWSPGMAPQGAPVTPPPTPR
jgi:hypothetical protein